MPTRRRLYPCARCGVLTDYRFCEECDAPRPSRFAWLWKWSVITLIGMSVVGGIGAWFVETF